MKVAQYTFALIVVLASGGQVNDAKTENAPQTDVQAISTALAKDQIGKVEILQIPPRILMRAQVSPEALERQYHNKLIIRDINANAYRAKVIEAFKTISVQPRNDTADLRWGVVFYSLEGTRVGAVYFERSGRYGAVNNLPVSFRGNFFHWLDDTFSSCLQ